jgi:hypothetical protein
MLHSARLVFPSAVAQVPPVIWWEGVYASQASTYRLRAELWGSQHGMGGICATTARVAREGDRGPSLVHSSETDRSKVTAKDCSVQHWQVTSSGAMRRSSWLC